MGWLRGIGWPELLVVLAIALLVAGGQRLPEAGRALGQAIRGFQEAVRGDSPNGQGTVRPAGASPPPRVKEDGVPDQDGQE